MKIIGREWTFSLTVNRRQMSTGSNAHVLKPDTIFIVSMLNAHAHKRQLTYRTSIDTLSVDCRVFLTARGPDDPMI